MSLFASAREEDHYGKAEGIRRIAEALAKKAARQRAVVASSFPCVADLDLEDVKAPEGVVITRESATSVHVVAHPGKHPDAVK